MNHLRPLTCLLFIAAACGDDAPPMGRCPEPFIMVGDGCALPDGGVPDGCVPEEETCDGADNDCDGRLDEALSQECGVTVGTCMAGTETCFAGEWEGCDAVLAESNDTCGSGMDEDCDGTIDEECTCTAGETRPCAELPGECVAGTQTCSSSAEWGECVGAVGPTDELCDGLDNDCDGNVDNGEPGAGVGCGSDEGECAMGVTTCMGGALVCMGEVLPSDEMCDGLDNDCDGTVDNGVLSTFFEDGDGDGFGDSASSRMACMVPDGFVDDDTDCDDEERTRFSGAPEICDGLDNDCDDDDPPDATFDCVLASSVDCTTSCGTTGTGTCTDECEIPDGDDCTPPEESCTYTDNDCDGRVDEGLTEFDLLPNNDVSPNGRIKILPLPSGYLVVYSSESGLRARRHDAEGVATGSAATLSTTSTTVFDVDLIDDTTAVVIWSRASGITVRRLRISATTVANLGSELELTDDIRAFQLSGVAVSAGSDRIYFAYSSPTFNLVLGSMTNSFGSLGQRSVPGFAIPETTGLGDIYGQFDLDTSSSGVTLAFTRELVIGTPFNTVSVGRVVRGSTGLMTLDDVTEVGQEDSEQPRVVSAPDGRRLVGWVRIRPSSSDGELGVAEFPAGEWEASELRRGIDLDTNTVSASRTGYQYALAFGGGRWLFANNDGLRSEYEYGSLTTETLEEYGSGRRTTFTDATRATAMDLAGVSTGASHGVYSTIAGYRLFRLGCE